MRTDSYRGITLTSMVSKVLESLVLERLESVFVAAGLPHVNQSAYRRAVSCADAIFVTQEMIPNISEEEAACTCACTIYKKPSTL